MRFAVVGLVIMLGLIGFLLLPTATDSEIPVYELQKSATVS